MDFRFVSHFPCRLFLTVQKGWVGLLGHRDICVVPWVCVQKSRQRGEQSKVISLRERRPYDGGECLELRPCRRGRISEASFTCDNAPQSVNTLFAHLKICTVTVASWSSSDTHHAIKPFSNLVWIVLLHTGAKLKSWIWCKCGCELISQQLPVV